MPAPKVHVDNIISCLKQSAEIADVCTSVWAYKANTAVIEFESKELKFALDLTYIQGGFVGSVLGRSDPARRTLRNALVGTYEMAKAGGERHILGEIPLSQDLPYIAAVKCHEWLTRVIGLIGNQLYISDSHMEADCINALWWDKKPNFGDAIGPWLISKIANKSPINGHGRKLSSPPLMTVGSILNLIERDETVVWGTGLMGPLSDAAVQQLSTFENVSVRAVRGRLTRDEVVEKLGWEVPEVFGDPGLLLPRFLPIPKGREQKDLVAVVPHYLHMDYFKQLESNSVRVLDVQDGLERVVRQIATARVCLSTSLHGVIIAQAYGVPWVWVRVEDHKLGGDTFKFEDFFSTLDVSAVRSVDVAKDDIAAFDVHAVADAAALPELQISLDALLLSFPLMAQVGVSSKETPHSSTTPQGVEEVEVPEDIVSYVENLLQKIDTIAGELAEQRRLLEQLAKTH
ncbi:polysaccharide pyruvyl transferase family protein [Arthrobacter sp. 08Y14]|uniref:polysaccharide pyruvyl transferase family protein n=1 Tax=Arthrobacter sp. 08Y14 TaxID=2058885 RepID=UPI000CE2C62C|nr:polysaccharide pyruvyl transferase family protein [Arthrobacter sp. 08Y14]